MATQQTATKSAETCGTVQLGQTGNKTAEHARIAREIYNVAKSAPKAETKKDSK